MSDGGAISGDAISGDAISGDAITGDAISGFGCILKQDNIDYDMAGVHTYFSFNYSRCYIPSNIIQKYHF
jgi:hypothetical protein